MDQRQLLKRIQEQRDFILWAEMGALLHDIGKLSTAFYKYRKTWRQMVDGWNKDPHDHEFLTEHDDLIKEGHPIKKLFQYVPPFMANTHYKEAQTCSIETFVNTHIDPKDELTVLLKAADGKDAAMDRNNPLFTAEQEDKIFDTDVFGSEKGNEFKIDSAKTSRGKLYDKLLESELLSRYFEHYHYKDRNEVFSVIQHPFNNAFSDTSRPDNDTSLWEHSYAVATIFKVLLAHDIIYNEQLDTFDKVRFGIMGIGWDGLSFISRGHKIGDIAGREATIDKLKDCIRRLVEHEYLLGNCIYEDLNGIYFLIPEQQETNADNADNLENYKKILELLKADIMKASLDITFGDIHPKFCYEKSTAYMTHLTKCIRELRKKIKVPFVSIENGTSKFLKGFWDNATGLTVCPLCGRRPIDEKWEICTVCNDRRMRVFGKRAPLNDSSDNIQTPFIYEIAHATDKSGKSPNRVALIAAKFGLDEWLNGKMIRSLFVTEAHGLEKEIKELGKTKSFENEENKAKEWLKANGKYDRKYKYDLIRKEIDICNNFDTIGKPDKEYAENILFLYERRNKFVKGVHENIYNKHMADVHESWSKWLTAAQEELLCDTEDIENKEALLYDIICAKTPTPSTILDVWQTTEKFFKDLCNVNVRDETLLWTEKKSRVKANVEKPAGVKVIAGMIYEGTLDGKDVEIVWLSPDEKNESAFIVKIPYDKAKALEGKSHVTLEGKPFGKKKDITTGPLKNISPFCYYPVKIITSTPDLFLALVPADKALEITNELYKRYFKCFGKVFGRLPFSIGNIFFDEKTPMFVVLDSARRMINNFEKLAERKSRIEIEVLNDPTEEDTISFRFNYGDAAAQKRLQIKLPHKLGDGKPDYYHPYLPVKKDSGDYSSRKNYFKTPIGDVIHFTDVKKADVLDIYPNYYDFEYLDSNARRYDLMLGKNNKRYGYPFKFLSKPYIMEEFSLYLQELWDKIQKVPSDPLLPGITDTKLRNLETLWLSKFMEWNVDSSSRDSDDFKNWSDLIEASVKSEFKKYRGGDNAQDFNYLKESILSGAFFDCLELYLRILKERVKNGGE